MCRGDRKTKKARSNHPHALHDPSPGRSASTPLVSRSTRRQPLPVCESWSNELCERLGFILKHAYNKAKLKRPELVTGAKLRKYLVTVSQILNLDNNQLECVANHLGHDLSVHRQFYRLPEEVIQIAKVSQLLPASEQGQVHRYRNKCLDEIDVTQRCR